MLFLRWKLLIQRVLFNANILHKLFHLQVPSTLLFQVAQLSQEMSWTYIFLEPQKTLPSKTGDLECNIKGFPNYVQRNENAVKPFFF